MKTILDLLLYQPKHNIVTQQKGWRMSYNPYCVDTEQSETAIMFGPEGKERFLILYGDHREQLKRKNRKEAIAYWKSKPELRGSTSSDENGDY